MAHFRELAAGMDLSLSAYGLAAIDKVLPVGWAHGDRQMRINGPERYS